MRSLRSRTLRALLSPFAASCCNGNALPTGPAVRCLSTVTQITSKSPAPNYETHLASDSSTSQLLTPRRSPSSSKVRADSAVLFPRLSQRQMRQRQQKWGILWRYRPEKCPSHHAIPSMSCTTASSLSSVSVPPPRVTQSCAADEAQRAKEPTAALRPLSLNHSECLRERLQDSEESGNASLSSYTCSVGATPVDGVTPDRVRNPLASTSTEGDPLLAFLDRHEEDAALLLAMWTSLHRSCVFGSALSETVVLQVRYLLHSLLRYRAVGAAVNFYHWLTGIGVQLHQSDLLFLFSSLTYENVSSTEEAASRKASEAEARKKHKKRCTQRRQEWGESTGRTHARNTLLHRPQKSPAEVRNERTSTREPVATVHVREARGHVFYDDDSAPVKSDVREHIKKMTSETHKCGGSHRAEGETGSTALTLYDDRRNSESEVRPPGSIARHVSFHQQPEWIKRWILYEASMGTLDALDGVEDDGDPGALLQSTTHTLQSSRDGKQAGPVTQYKDPMQMMEVRAIVEHLHLLMLGAMQREYLDTARLTNSPPVSLQGQQRSLRRSRPAAVAKTYWKEALQVVRTTYLLGPWATDMMESDTADYSQAVEKVFIPSDITLSLRSMLREAHSWEGALAFLRLTAPKVKLSGDSQLRTLRMSSECFRRGVILFMALAARAQPWKVQASIDEWMHHVMLPVLAHCTRASVEGPVGTVAATAALHALWLSHLCGVKASQPDEFVTRVEQAAAYLTMNSTKQAIHGELTFMTSEVRAGTERAIAILQRAVREVVQHQRASEALAKSIRSGAYRTDRIEQSHECSSVAESYHTVDESSVSSASAPVAAVSGVISVRQCSPRSSSLTPARLSSDVTDAFALCCAAVKETVWLQFTTSASVHSATATVGVLQFLERSVHGPSGLLNVFQLMYGSFDARRCRQDSGPPSAPSMNTPSATERGCMSCLLATTLLQLVQLLCSPPSQQSRRFGSRMWNAAELVLLVEVAVKVLNGVSTEDLGQAPWRWVAQQRLRELAHTTAGTLRVVMLELDINRMNERVMFGALTDLDIQLLALLAQVFNQSSELTMFCGSKVGRGRSSQSLVWRILTSTCSPRTLQGVHMCFRNSSALGKRVRQRLSRRDTDHLDYWIQPPRSSQRTSARLQHARGLRPPFFKEYLHPRAASETVMFARSVGRDFHLTRDLSDSVYKIVSCERTPADVGQALVRLASTMKDWKASLLLCQIVTKDVALARGTCTVDFFATTLSQIAEDIKKSSAAALSAARHSSMHGSCSRVSGERYGAVAASHTCGPANLWLKAIEVFWRAVDHTETGKPDAVLSADRSDIAACAKPLTSHAVDTGAQERAVLAQLLLPLIQFSRAAHRRELGRQWLRVWAGMYTSQEKQSLKWRQQNIEALSLLGEAAALTRCVAEYPHCGSESLLCSVAARHSEWGSALEALFKTYGTLEELHATHRSYSHTVARTILTLLAKSPQNLSNTAMRLRTVQREMWDAECSLEVVRLLLRSRRWRLALTHVDEAMELPEMQRVRVLVLVDPTGLSRQQVSETSPTEAMLTHYAHLLAAALQAAAIGGDSERAPAYHDAFKAFLRYVFGEGIDCHTLSTSKDAAEEGGIDRLDAALSTTHLSFKEANHALHVEDSVQELMRELAPRARIFFFRAMTKKMFSSPSAERGQRI